jgi:hypothetical protein
MHGALRTLVDYSRRGGIDLLHGHTSKAWLLAAAGRAGRASVLHAHTWAFQRPAAR